MENFNRARDIGFKKAIEGHSFLITGQCGTGKTSLLKKIVGGIKTDNVKKIAVTATTGMASLQLGHGASTIHHWTGILDGRYSHEKLAELFDNDDLLASAKRRILETTTLIIDEISMLSKKVFDMIEFSCRHVKQNNLTFGGIQVIGCGDFKQLPPVPNRRYDDDGSYCFLSNRFHLVFPHHINLNEVVRQNEPELISAITELGDGMPSEETIAFIKRLERPIDVPSANITRLLGTNFDTKMVNYEMLMAMDGEEFAFKAKDEGNPKCLTDCVVPKTLLLKKGAKVMLVKNISAVLCNGLQGFVHHVTKDTDPVINFNGKLVPLSPEHFDVFDVKKQKNLATRIQYPIILAYALTVHRAQGQTLQNVEIDCYGFFAPGQMGVALGRATSTSGLRVLHYNHTAATKKHPDEVYDFYEKKFVDFSADLSCCDKSIVHRDEPIVASLPLETLHPDGDLNVDFEIDNDRQLPSLESPWDLQDFVSANKSSPYLREISDEFLQSDNFGNHLNFLYHTVNTIVCENLKNSQQWTSAYKKLNTFLLSEDHTSSLKTLFRVQEVNKLQNKLSTKLVFWLIEKEIDKKASDLIEKQNKEVEAKADQQTHDELTAASKSKIRYIAGACIQKIAKRLRESVLRKLGQCSKKSQFQIKMDYKKQKLLKIFRINEEDVPDQDDTMAEIDYKQGPTRGLTVVNDDVFEFFVLLNNVLQQKLSHDHINLYFEVLHNFCRDAIDDSEEILEKWSSLFEVNNEEGIEDEIFLTLTMELYLDVTEHFIRIAFVDSLNNFKRSVPRKKKQALRTKIQALSERQTPSSSQTNSSKRKTDDKSQTTGKKKQKSNLEVQESEKYMCNTCQKECEWEPSEVEDESIACDKCNCWYHYKCVKIKGTEAFLNKASANWYCTNCSRKGKGRGKGKGK